MKKHSLPLLLAAPFILLCAFSIAPSQGLQEDRTLTVTFTTSIETGGSGTLQEEMAFSAGTVEWFTSQGILNVSEAEFCDTMITGDEGISGWTQEERDGGLACVASQPFEDLKELESLTIALFTGASFDRLEIADNHLYYDLALNVESAVSTIGEIPVQVEGYWILKVPGAVDETNADTTDGRTLTWDLMKVTKSTHFRAECKLGGGGLFGSDSTLMVAGAVLLLGCCCVVVLVGGGAAFFFLRRKKSPPEQPGG